MIYSYYISYFFLLSTINFAEYFFLSLVLKPFAGIPLRDLGCPPEALPSPPPIGWSIGFLALARDWGMMPIWRLRPALPIETLIQSMLPSCPTVARHEQQGGPGAGRQREPEILVGPLARPRPPVDRFHARGLACVLNREAGPFPAAVGGRHVEGDPARPLPAR